MERGTASPGFTRLNRSDIYKYEQQQRKKLSSVLIVSNLPRTIPIDEWEEWAAEAGVIFPDDMRKIRWDVGMLIAILYSTAVVPWRLGMDKPATGVYWGVEVLVSLYFMLDFGLNFFVAIPNAEADAYIIDRGEIARSYCLSWAIVDAASSLPHELIEIFVQTDESDLSSLRLLRSFRLLRLLRLLRFLKVKHIIELIEDALNVELQVLSLLKLLLFVFYLTHCLGCLWFSLHAQAPVGQQGQSLSTWLSEYRDGELLDAGVWSQYLLSVYWALMTLTTVGYGDIVPANDLERLVALFSLLVGVLVFGSLVSALGELVSSYNIHASQIDEKLRELKEYCRWHRVPLDLTVRVRKYAAFLYSRRHPMDEELVLRPLAPALRRELTGLLARTVHRIPLFAAVRDVYGDHGFQAAVHRRLKPLIREQREELISKGKWHPDMYFLVKGACTATGDLELMFFELSAFGACFGEEVMLHRPAPLSYVLKTQSELLCLSRDDFHALVRTMGHDRRRELAEAILEEHLKHLISRNVTMRFMSSGIKHVRARVEGLAEEGKVEETRSDRDSVLDEGPLLRRVVSTLGEEDTPLHG